MHGETNIKFISAQQARTIYNFRNIKVKLQKTIASIWFNKICKSEQLQPKYIHIKISGHNKRSQDTKTTAVKYRINQEIKHLYKKAALNKQLYATYLECANYWQEAWFCIQRSENQKIQNRNDILYNISSTKNSILCDIRNENKPNTKIPTHRRPQNSIHVSKTCQTLHSTEKKKKYLN
jgi:hypothetical protein